MSIRIRFDAQLSTHSQKGEFPPDTIAAVFVTNRDDCTYMNVPVTNKGLMSVDFSMEPTKKDIKLTDRIKFHFYFRDNEDNMLKPVCAGHMPLVDLADKLNVGGVFDVGSNFNTNTVRMAFLPNTEHSRDMHLDLLKLYNTNAITKSVLGESAKHMANIKKMDQIIKKGLEDNTQITSENGGHMFRSVFTAHMMENEATLYTLYHTDFDEPHAVPPWLCTYMLAETLSHNALTVEQVKAMTLPRLTEFLSSYAQGPMRSASSVPYTLDMTLNEDPRMYNRKRTMLSEIFKRPYSHPHWVLQGLGTLQTDDCEGLVVMLQNLTNHLGHMYTTHSEDFKQANAYLPYNNLMKRYFPKDLFAGMTSQFQNKLMDLALYLGEYVANKTIECKVTLVSANGASMGGEGAQRQVQAHACASMVCNHPDSPYAVMMEGTACATDDQDSRRMRIGDDDIVLADVANMLSKTEPFNKFVESDMKTKIAMHLTHSHGSFYRTAFCQNDSMLGSQIGQRKVMFGVDMEYLSDESVKIYMPVKGKDLPPGEFEQLKQYVQARRVEIHPPLVDHTELRESLKWAPIAPFKGCKELDATRPYTTCLVHVLANENHPLESLLQRATAEANEFNAEPENLKLGCMRAFASMDGVSKVFHLYSDNTDALAKRLARPKRVPPQPTGDPTVVAS